MIALIFMVCFVTVSVCATAVLCNEKRMRHRYEMARLKAAQERLLLGAGEDTSRPAPWESTYGTEG